MIVEVRNSCADYNSYRAARVKSLFNAESGANFSIDANLDIEDKNWRIGVIVGPSGSGKTSLGKIVWPGVSIYSQGAGFHADRPLVDCIAPEGESVATWEPSWERPPMPRY